MLLLFSLYASAQQSVGVNNTQTIKTTGFKLYPNPAYGDEIYITTAATSEKTITIFDVFGEAVLKERITGNSLNIARLVPGIYVLQIVQDDKKMTRKLVVK